MKLLSFSCRPKRWQKVLWAGMPPSNTTIVWLSSQQLGDENAVAQKKILWQNCHGSIQSCANFMSCMHERLSTEKKRRVLLLSKGQSSQQAFEERNNQQKHLRGVHSQCESCSCRCCEGKRQLSFLKWHSTGWTWNSLLTTAQFCLTFPREHRQVLLAANASPLCWSSALSSSAQQSKLVLFLWSTVMKNSLIRKLNLWGVTEKKCFNESWVLISQKQCPYKR